MRFAILIAFVLFNLSVKGQIILTDANLNKSCADKCWILEDPKHALTINDILPLEYQKFEKLQNRIEILDFNSSRWWVILEVTNQSSIDQILLDIARPITNKVDLYQIHGDTVYKKWQNGDGHPYDFKDFRHRKSMFDITVPRDSTVLFIVELESDGEVISMPVRFWNKSDFIANDYNVQFAYGFYYGMLILVAFIFFFFFLILKDASFLNYVVYVFFQILLQFSLDGYAFQLFFPNGGYMTNHIVLLSAGGTVVFVIIYARSFLKSKIHAKIMDTLLRYSAIGVGLVTLLSLIPGTLYEISYPAINALSLIGILMIIVTIFGMKARGHKVDNYFTAAFVILIVGAVIFILGNFHLIGNAEISQAALKVSSGLEVMALSVSMANEYRRLQQEKELAQYDALQSLKERNELIDKMNVELEKQVSQRTHEIELQKEELSEKNHDILSSIKYAKRIQQAMLPNQQHIQSVIPNSFILYKPRDIVSGDFYFVNEVEYNGDILQIFAAVDCTGHGVPGAFLSILGTNYLNQSLREPSVNSPAAALDYLNKRLYETLRFENHYDIKDGMDMALCTLNRSNNVLTFAGAKNPVYVIRKNEQSFEKDYPNHRYTYNEDRTLVLMEIKGDRHAIGALVNDQLPPYGNVEIQLKPGDLVMLFSDGFPDQFGGPKGKKYNYKRFKQTLLELYQYPTRDIHAAMEKQFTDWKGEHNQIDDVLVLGVRV